MFSAKTLEVHLSVKRGKKIIDKMPEIARFDVANLFCYLDIR